MDSLVQHFVPEISNSESLLPHIVVKAVRKDGLNCFWRFVDNGAWASFNFFVLSWHRLITIAFVSQNE